MSKNLKKKAVLSDMQIKLNTALLDASKSGNCKAVQKLIAKGADINVQDEHLVTALMYAAANGDLATTNALLKAGADVNAGSNPVNSALLLAAESNSTKIVKALLKSGNVEAGSIDNAVIAAVENDNLKMTEALLEASKGPTCWGTQYEEALCIAVDNRSYKIVAALLNSGFCDFEAPEEGANPAQYRAILQNDPKMIQLILNYCYFSIEEMLDFLESAIYNGFPEAFDAILDVLESMGDDVLESEEDMKRYNSLLQDAIEQKQPRIVKSLLDSVADVDVNIVFRRNWTPLMLAIKYCPEVVKSILNAGADVNAKDIVKETPLMYAASYSTNPALFKTLLKAGARKQDKNSEGKTAYDIACSNGALKGSEILELLADKGCKAA